MLPSASTAAERDGSPSLRSASTAGNRAPLDGVLLALVPFVPIFPGGRIPLASRTRQGLDELQYGQGKGGGLARSGLRGGKHVPTGENLGDRLCLDGSRTREAEGVDPGEDVLV